MDQNSKNNILIKNHLAYLNSSAIFEFLKQFARSNMEVTIVPSRSQRVNPKRPGGGGRIIFLKIGPRVMMRRCVIERWVQRKTDQKLIFNGNYTQIVFFVFRIHFHYVLSYLFGLFGVRTCVSIL